MRIANAPVTTGLAYALAVLALASCGSRRDVTAPAPEAAVPYDVGIASWYGPGLHGNKTASGEIFDQNALTAAHPTLPFGTRVRVVHAGNGKEVVVRINDRGPFSGNRIIDLSRAAAESLGMLRQGTARVRLFVIE
jgi:rare lipoprotein A